MPKAEVNGTRIHYDIAVSGPPLVVTAGQGTGPDARQALIDRLARSHSVLTYDQRGTGRSDPAAQTSVMEDLARDIAGLMDAAGFASAGVIGISTGTGKATALAGLFPERVSRLVLAAPWTHGDDYLTMLQNMRIAAARTMPADHYFHLNALLIYPPGYRREHFAQLEAGARQALGRPQNADSIAGRLNAILAFDARKVYPRIQCPTLVMGARDDQVMPFWFAQEAARAIPGAELVLLEHGGHLFAETDPDTFTQHALPFLQASRPASGAATRKETT